VEGMLKISTRVKGATTWLEFWGSAIGQQYEDGVRLLTSLARKG
jgi:hypothetical protein